MSDGVPAVDLAGWRDGLPERFVPGQMSGVIAADHIARYAWASTIVARQRVLDVGCGVGYGARILAEAGAESVIGVDPADEILVVVSPSMPRAVTLLSGSAEALPVADGSIDVVTCFEVIEHLGDRHRALDEIRRVLAPAGILCISSPNRLTSRHDNPHHVYEYTESELVAELSVRFENVRTYRQFEWVFSAVVDDAALEALDNGHPPAQMRHLPQLKAHEQTYVVAVAGNGTLPDPSAVGVFDKNTDIDAHAEAGHKLWADILALQAANQQLDRWLRDLMSLGDARAVVPGEFELFLRYVIGPTRTAERWLARTRQRLARVRRQR